MISLLDILDLKNDMRIRYRVEAALIKKAVIESVSEEEDAKAKATAVLLSPGMYVERFTTQLAGSEIASLKSKGEISDDDIQSIVSNSFSKLL